MPPALRSLMSVIVGYLALWFSFLFLTAIFHQILKGNWAAFPLLAVQFAISLIASAVGGYVAALMAPSRPLVHAGVIAIIMLLFSLKSFSALQTQLPMWYLTIATAGTPLAVLVGAALDSLELRKQK